MLKLKTYKSTWAYAIPVGDFKYGVRSGVGVNNEM